MTKQIKKGSCKAPFTFTGFTEKDYKAVRRAISVFKGFAEELGNKGQTEIGVELLVVESNLQDTLAKMQLATKALRELKDQLVQAKEKSS